MTHLTIDNLLSLESYSTIRSSVRQQMIAYKKKRQFYLGEHARLAFEDATTIQYQIQEMLRVERIFEADAIQDELDAYNPLIPDGNNWKATLMLEYPDVEVRKKALAKLVGIEHKIWMEVSDFAKVYAIANEDMERSTLEKTSSVHFLRFQLSDPMVAACLQGAGVSMGIDHDNYRVQPTRVPEITLKQLVSDLSPGSGHSIFNSSSH
jgi:hypothetical protein